MTGPRSVALTPAQAEVVRELLYDGADSATIARRLGIPPLSVNGHIREVYKRTGLGSRTELVVAILRGRLTITEQDRRHTAA